MLFVFVPLEVPPPVVEMSSISSRSHQERSDRAGRHQLVDTAYRCMHVYIVHISVQSKIVVIYLAQSTETAFDASVHLIACLAGYG